MALTPTATVLARIRLRKLWPAALVAAVAALAALPLPAAGMGGMNRANVPTVTVLAATASYRMVLDVGPVAGMLMPAEALSAAARLKGTEIMLPGPRQQAPMMAMSTDGHSVNRHLELHIFVLRTGAVVAFPIPRLHVENAKTRMGFWLRPVVAMYGARPGLADLHYGNNVYLPPGTYDVVATESGQTARFPAFTIRNGSTASTEH